MSRNQRLALVAAFVAAAAVAFVVAKPGDGGDGASGGTAPPRTEIGDGGGGQANDTARPRRRPTRIALRRGSVAGGARTITAERGESVRIVVTSDTPDELHLHGFNITRKAAPGGPARFNFRADIEGEFELESHTAEDAGRDPRVARVRVGPA
jgi:hypothetical protein